MTARPRLRQLEAPKSDVDRESTTAAAQRLEISQSAVSRLLVDLSGALGFALLNGKNGRLVPARETGNILPDIARMLGMFKNFTVACQDLHGKTAGHLSIACLAGFAASHLPQVVTGFLKARPDVTLTLEPDRAERILEWIVGEQYDCAIPDGFNGHPAIDCTMLNVRTLCIFPEGHRVQGLKQGVATQLYHGRFVHTGRDSNFYRTLNDVFRNASASPSKITLDFLEDNKTSLRAFDVRRGGLRERPFRCIEVWSDQQS